jgi:fructokinase
MKTIDVVGTGFAVLDRIYGCLEGPLEALGGSCGNVLASLAMLERKVAPVLSLGDDEVGARLVREFASAGAMTSYIARRPGLASPVLAQVIHQGGTHHFTYSCPVTKAPLPRYRPADGAQMKRAKPAFADCSVLYADRMTTAVFEAMRTSAVSGGFVFFEPSSVGARGLFDKALSVCSLIKYSAERLGALADEVDFPEHVIVVVTHGAAGLELRQGTRRLWCPAQPTAMVRDTCGAGDMVSVGIIDWLLTLCGSAGVPDIEQLAPGVAAGQRLASVNCAYAGARGVFRERGAAFVRDVLASRG